jgi:hypothetical protein
MPMKNNTKRKRDFRAALAEAGMVRPDRLTEMMSAIAGGGSQRCEGCGRQTWCSDIAEFDVCSACRAAFRRLKKKPPRPRPRLSVSHVEPNVVWADASYRDGRAGLAVVGALGEHSRTVDAVSSTQAEVLALRWAMDIAEAGDVPGLMHRLPGGLTHSSRSTRGGAGAVPVPVPPVPAHLFEPPQVEGDVSPRRQMDVS